MSISRKTADEFATDLEGAVLSRNSSYDTKIGPIPDLVIRPTANVLELQNERIRSVQQLLSLVNDGSFTDTDLDNFVFNELLLRLRGSRALATLVFSRATVPTTDLVVQANFPVATLADESTGITVTFLTLAQATLVAANASAYFNPDTQRYELLISAQATSAAEAGNVGPNRIRRPLRPLNGFDTVFNRDTAIDGRDPETADQLVSRYYLSLVGTSPATINGLKKILRDQYPTVADSNIIYGNNPLNVRASSDSGAVDVYVIGAVPTSITENVVFPGPDQVISLNHQPIIAISGAGSFVQGTDFTLVKDTSGVDGSVRAQDGIKWLSSGTTPAIGDVVAVTYSYNGLVQQLQDAFSTDDLTVPGRDLLFKVAIQVDVTISASIKIRAGFSVPSVVSAVSSAILALINDSKLGNDVEGSDIQAVVRAFTGVDNFVITNLARVGQTGTSDISVDDNEFARINVVDLILTVA
jgi:uncharacterized phage protein gp47/JayE